MADVTKTLQIVVTAQDNASAGLNAAAGSASMFGSVLAALGIANVVNDLINLGKAAFETGYNFQVALEDIQGNTGMTNAQISQMTKEVQALGQQSGVSTTDLANAFKYAFDISKSMNDSLSITQAAMEAVRIAGGNMSDATRILAITMHDFNVPASDATKTMDTLLKIVQGGAGNFADLNSQFTVLAGTASAIGVPLDQTGALFDALTRRLGDANRASVEANMFLLAVADAHKSVQAAIGNTTSAVTGSTKAHKDYSDAIASATDKIKSEEDRLSSMKTKTTAQKDAYQNLTDTIKTHQDALTALEAKQNGVATSAMSKVDPALRGLAGDFSDAGIKAKGIIGILQDINDASSQNSQELQKLFPNYRSLYAAMGLTADGGKDVKQSLKNIDTATSAALNKEYQDRLQKIDGQWGILSETIKNKVINAFAQAAPVIDGTLKVLNWSEGQTTEKKYEEIGQAIGNIAKTAEKTLVPFFQKLPGEFTKMHNQIDQENIKFWEKDLPFAVGQGVGNLLNNWIPQLVEGTITNFNKMYTETDTWMQNTWTNITKWWQKTSDDTHKINLGSILNIHNDFVAIQKTVDSDMNAVWKTVSDWWGKIQDIFNSIIKAAENVINKVTSAFSAGVASTINHRAGGGYASGLTLVGESGPELLQLPTASYVHSNSETKNMMGGAQVTIQFNGGVQLDSPDRVKQLANQIIKIIGRQNELAQRGFSV